jgi:PhzF family phenazine biosynthesis protein
MQPDGTFPNHEANPLKEENLDPVRELVKKTKSRLGVGFDGDADRCCFVDEAGRTVGNDLMTALLAREILAQKKGAPIVYDLRSSWVVKEEIQKAGGVAIRDRVGHSFIKATMRSKGALFGGELSGHFYFAENYTCDSGELAMVSALNLIARSATPFSELVQGLRRYHSTGEINFHVDDKDAAIRALKHKYKDWWETKAEIEDWNDQADIARGLGLSREDLDETLPIQACSTGNTMLMVPVRSLADLGRSRPNLLLLEEVYARNGFSSSGATGCYAFTRETIEIGEARAHARFFVGQNIGEDPATGSAAGPLGGYLVYHDATRVDPVDGVYRFLIEQGDFIGRPSRIELEVKGAPGKVTEVRVGGPSVVVARGVLEF